MDISKELSKTIQKLISNRALQNKALQDQVIAIFLFGSFAKNSARKQSDIDLAFVFKEKYYKEDPFRSLQMAELLCVEISRKINKAVDVVILNSASLGFTFHAVKNGVCLFESSTVDRILYEVAVQNKYEDFMPFIEDLRNSKREKLLGRD